jgi:putative Mg2+ transporter-C (MgtC) family protein
VSLDAQFTSTLKLGFALLLSALIGLDRERLHRPAGLQTHILVGLGACLFTLISMTALPTPDTRIAANVVVGIGFLGAGAIFHRQETPHDLTTAASIWITAAVGMAIGVGAWFLALCAALMVWFVLVIVRKIEIAKRPANPDAKEKG